MLDELAGREPWEVAHRVAPNALDVFFIGMHQQ
jgi:hypothetical protein